jgi:hypothetical protein
MRSSFPTNLAGDLHRGQKECAGIKGRWRQKKKIGDAAAFESYQKKILSAREAWQMALVEQR